MSEQPKQVVILRVKFSCKTCVNKVISCLSRIEGVDEVTVDVKIGKVTVVGEVDPLRLLKKVRGTGKCAEFWIDAISDTQAADQPVVFDETPGQELSISAGNIAGDNVSGFDVSNSSRSFCTCPSHELVPAQYSTPDCSSYSPPPYPISYHICAPVCVRSCPRCYPDYYAADKYCSLM
ncbi:hypothetical protein O6H91_08G021400 [Diphasiastrum complanatum]|uniref:Uncharacterized protein n=1 Tax=Diphasiastrum complanatum TaxID=34168 RepID=A0ACC2CVP3_DIPCM|nr:hypothetical protein O6H91_08G021400 [Diphasiastrum complanatum]